MPYSLESKVIVIVGATQGIGAVTARRLCEEGATVILGGVRVERGHAFAKEISKAICFHVARCCPTCFGKRNIRCNAIQPGMIMTEKAWGMADRMPLDAIRTFTPSPRLNPFDTASAS